MDINYITYDNTNIISIFVRNIRCYEAEKYIIATTPFFFA
jgi:hypothetical protein